MRNNEVRTIIKSDGKKYSIRLNRNRIFLPSEWNSFYQFLKGDKQKITFNFLINTGARINEARHIKVEDINFKEKTIILKCVKKRNNYSIGRIREIPISTKFCKYLKKIIKEYNLNALDYFPILSTPASNIAMKKALIKSNISDWKMFSVHNIRKTLECWLVGLNLSTLKVLAHFGHNQSTCLTYYVKTDTLNQYEKSIIPKVIGNLYFCNGDIQILYERINLLEKRLIQNA